LFEHIRISPYGNGQRTISSSIVSVTYGPEVIQEFSVDKNHYELCTDPKERCSDVRTANAAVAWEKALADFIEADFRSLTSLVGTDLLTRSEQFRMVAKKYWMRLRQLNQETNCEYLATHLKANLSRDELTEPDRVADAIVGDLTMLAVYQAAAITIQMFSQEIEGIRDPFAGQHVHENEPLISRVAILADLFLREDAELCSKF
jgi:hypothetical protein